MPSGLCFAQERVCEAQREQFPWGAGEAGSHHPASGGRCPAREVGLLPTGAAAVAGAGQAVHAVPTGGSP